jgi:hypothetical protein
LDSTPANPLAGLPVLQNLVAVIKVAVVHIKSRNLTDFVAIIGLFAVIPHCSNPPANCTSYALRPGKKAGMLMTISCAVSPFPNPVTQC